MAAVLLSTVCVRAEDVLVAQAQLDGTVRLRIFVTAKSGDAVTNLRRQDFTIYDRGAIQPITSFRVVLPKRQQGKQGVVTVSLKRSEDANSPADIYPLYEISFEGARSRGPREFHQIEVRVDRPNLRVETSQGYLTTGH
jgi:hypothetical protein